MSTYDYKIKYLLIFKIIKQIFSNFRCNPQKKIPCSTFNRAQKGHFKGAFVLLGRLAITTGGHIPLFRTTGVLSIKSGDMVERIGAPFLGDDNLMAVYSSLTISQF